MSSPILLNNQYNPLGTGGETLTWTCRDNLVKGSSTAGSVAYNATGFILIPSGATDVGITIQRTNQTNPPSNTILYGGGMKVGQAAITIENNGQVNIQSTATISGLQTIVVGINNGTSRLITASNPRTPIPSNNFVAIPPGLTGYYYGQAYNQYTTDMYISDGTSNIYPGIPFSNFGNNEIDLVVKDGQVIANITTNQTIYPASQLNLSKSSLLPLESVDQTQDKSGNSVYVLAMSTILIVLFVILMICLRKYVKC